MRCKPILNEEPRGTHRNIMATLRYAATRARWSAADWFGFKFRTIGLAQEEFLALVRREFQIGGNTDGEFF
jgi:hypothetical protein